jgi:tetratricopeptide (TPR) repeat protein
LALQPDNVQAADALRNIERERNKRSFLGKPSRFTLTRRATNEAHMAAPGTARAPRDRNEVEHAAVLGMQGELDEAIALLERHLAVDKSDTAACHMLADMYYQKAEKQLLRDKPGGIRALEKSLQLDASNARTATRLKQLKNGNAASVTMVSARKGCGATG